MDIQELADEIKNDKKPRQITPRELFNALGFERRTMGNRYWVDKFLNDNSLMVNPNYIDVWIDEPISLEHKPIAKTDMPDDPIRRINTLDSANTIPVYVNNDDPLLAATTLMQCNDFSQLPVVNGNVRKLMGYISWETIMRARINGVSSDMVKDYVDTNVATLTADTPLIRAIEVVKEHDFAIVLAKDNSLYGIVTVSDITTQFISETEPFVLLSELESHLRNLLRDKILVEDLKILCNCNGVEVTSIDDMTFGDYIAVFGNEKQWKKIKVAADRKTFIEALEKIRIIRNEVMHFRPGGIEKSKMEDLRQFVVYLRILSNYKNNQAAS